jgi:FkbH-like protein
MQESQLHQLASAMSGRRSGGLGLSPLDPLILAIVGNGTTDLLAEALAATGVRYGFDLRIVQGLFGQTMQEALSPESAINAARPDYVLPVVDYRALPVAPGLGPGDADGEDAAVAAACGWLNAVREGFRRHAGATVVVPTVPVPPEPLFGGLDAALPGSLLRILERVNRGIADAAVASGDLLLDVARLASTVGLESWFDAGFWNLGKLPFGPAFVPLYADAVVRTLAAARGKSRKCLVLDLDNTLWGGVIGDDGLDGIVLGNGSAKGEAFLAVQRFALALHGRGVVLAVSSKNQDEIARLPFRSHAEMLLKESDISVFQANWQDKASNLRVIAEKLNIGTDALVLLDDNPAERALVRREMPEVAVPEVSADPTDYPRLLAWAGYFDAVSLSREDAERGRYYEQNARRAELASSATDMDGYLASLDMEMTVSPFGPQGRSRIHQLINKTNQFNLTTRRYSEHQVEAFEIDPQALTFQIRLRDSFGDNGMISVVIGVADGETLEIDTWLMSCRVLNRGVETAVLGVLAAAARARGFSALRGVYAATAKNGLVRAHYQRLGFTRSGGDEERSVWVLPLGGFADTSKHIRVFVKDTE